jgi:hypothetical protein
MNKSRQDVKYLLPTQRWPLLIVSILTPFILLSVFLLSANTAGAGPLAPAADISGTVINPDGSAITDTTWVCLYHFSPNPDEGVDWDECKDTAVGGSFVFTGSMVPLGNLIVVADAPWYSDLFPSLPKPFHLANPADIIDLGPVTLTYASFAGMVYEPGGMTPADGGWISVVEIVDEDWKELAGGDYQTGTYAVGGVPSGDFMLVAHPPGDSPFWHSDLVPVAVTEGSQYTVGATQLISLELTMAQLLVYVDDPASDPITANVHLWDEWGFDMWREATPDHLASFGDLDVGGVYMLEAWPRWEDIPDVANSMVMTVAIGAGSISRTLSLQQPTIVGTIETPEGNPLPQAYEGDDPIPHPAEVYVQNVHEGWEVTMLVNPAGEFGLALPNGECVLEAHPYGNLAFTYTKSLREYFVLAGTVILPELDLGYIRLTYPSVVGDVFDPEGNPLPPDACLNVWLENMSGEWEASVWYCGGQDGPYMLGGVPDGDYWLKTDGVPELGFFPPDSILVHVPTNSQYDPDAVQFHDLHLVGAQLEVFIEHPPGTLVPAHVVLWDEWGFEAWSDHTLDRPAQFGGIPSGDYWLQAWPTWQDIPALANSDKEPIHIGEAPISHTLYLNVPDVTGTVETPEGDPLPPAHDEAGNWVPHPAEVHVHNTDWSVDIWATTNPTGEFSLSLPDGDYKLVAKPLHNLVFEYTKSDVQPFSLTPAVSRPHSLGYIPLTYPRVWGIVVDWEGNPIPTWVDLWNEDGSYWDGDDTYWYGSEMKPFLFGGMPEGHYYVQANPPTNNPQGYGPSNIEEFTIPPTYTEQITLYLGIANVLGDVRLPPDDPFCPDCPVPWADVKVLHDPNDGFEKWATTGEDGRFAFTLEPGDYALEVKLPHEWLAEWNPPPPEPFTLGEPPDQYHTTLYLQPSTERILVTGQVLTPPSGDPPPLGSAWIGLCDDEGLCFGNDVAASGRYTVSVIPGIYKVWVWVDPATGFAPPLHNGFLVLVEGDRELAPIWLRAFGDRTARVSGRVMLVSGQGLDGVPMEAWTDEGDWVMTETAGGGYYTLNLFPGHWHGGPMLTPEQEDEYIVLPPRIRDGRLEPGAVATGANFYLARRNATIQGQVVEVGQTTPITDIDAVVFVELCANARCQVIDESQVQTGAFELKVRTGFTYTQGVWLPSGGYIPGPPVTVTMVSTLTTGVQVSVIEAGTRIWGRLLDGDTLQPVEVNANVYGHNSAGLWVEDALRRGDDPYQYNLYVPTPVDEPITWTLGLWVDPSEGYIADPAHPRYRVVVNPGDTSVGQIMYVEKLDTFIVGRVGIREGLVFTPTRHAWVFAEGITGTTEGLYFEAQTNASGIFTMPVLPGEYEVGAYLPPDMVGNFFPPLLQSWSGMGDNPVQLHLRHRPTVGALDICGNLSVSPTASISDTAPIFVSGWSEDGDYSEVTGTIAGGYCLPVISGTTWHLWAAYEDRGDDAFYMSLEKTIKVGNASVSGVNLRLNKSPYDLPDAECWTYDPSRFKRFSLPAWSDMPEPLVEIQANTMPVTDDVTICAVPAIAVPNGQRLLGFAYEMEARDSDGNLITEDFNKSVRFLFYLGANALDDADPEELGLGFYSTARGEWVSLDDIFFDWDDPYWFFTGKIDHFSRFGILSPPVVEETESTLNLVEIAGPTTGVMTQTYTFTATVAVTGTNSLPLTYTWQATDYPTPTVQGVASSTLESTITYSWTMAGDKVITVTVTDGLHSIQDTHTITIASGYEIYLPLVMRNT